MTFIKIKNLENYIANSTFDDNISGWSGDSNITVSRTTTAAEVLNGVASLKIVKAAIDADTENASVAFTIPDGMQGEKLTIRFQMKNISGYVNGFIKIVIRDTTNSVDITPFREALPNSDGTYETEFRSSSDSTDYEIRLTIDTTDTSAFSLSFDDLFIGYYNPENRIFNIDSPRIISTTIPIISANTRIVHTVNLGKANPNRQMLGFYTSSGVDADIIAQNTGAKSNTQIFEPNWGNDGRWTDHLDQIGKGQQMQMETVTAYYRAIAVLCTRDYNDARKIMERPGSFTKYGAGGGSALPAGFGYTAIGVGILGAWYGSGDPRNGVFTIVGRLNCESMWLTQSAGDTILNIALFNYEASTATIAKSLKVVIYE